MNYLTAFNMKHLLKMLLLGITLCTQVSCVKKEAPARVFFRGAIGIPIDDAQMSLTPYQKEELSDIITQVVSEEHPQVDIYVMPKKLLNFDIEAALQYEIQQARPGKKLLITVRQGIPFWAEEIQHNLNEFVFFEVGSIFKSFSCQFGWRMQLNLSSSQALSPGMRCASQNNWARQIADKRELYPGLRTLDKAPAGPQVDHVQRYLGGETTGSRGTSGGLTSGSRIGDSGGDSSGGFSSLLG